MPRDVRTLTVCQAGFSVKPLKVSHFSQGSRFRHREAVSRSSAESLGEVLRLGGREEVGADGLGDAKKLETEPSIGWVFVLVGDRGFLLRVC